MNRILKGLSEATIAIALLGGVATTNSNQPLTVQAAKKKAKKVTKNKVAKNVTKKAAKKKTPKKVVKKTTSKKAAKKATKKTSKKGTKKATAKKPSKEVVKKTTKKSAKKAVTKTPKKTVKKAAKKSTKKAVKKSSKPATKVKKNTQKSASKTSQKPKQTSSNSKQQQANRTSQPSKQTTNKSNQKQTNQSSQSTPKLVSKNTQAGKYPPTLKAKYFHLVYHNSWNFDDGAAFYTSFDTETGIPNSPDFETSAFFSNQKGYFPKGTKFTLTKDAKGEVEYKAPVPGHMSDEITEYPVPVYVKVVYPDGSKTILGPITLGYQYTNADYYEPELKQSLQIPLEMFDYDPDHDAFPKYLTDIANGYDLLPYFIQNAKELPKYTSIDAEFDQNAHDKSTLKRLVIRYGEDGSCDYIDGPIRFNVVQSQSYSDEEYAAAVLFTGSNVDDILGVDSSFYQTSDVSNTYVYQEQESANETHITVNDNDVLVEYNANPVSNPHGTSQKTFSKEELDKIISLHKEDIDNYLYEQENQDYQDYQDDTDN